MKTYDEIAPSKYIMYLDANNLYGWAMSQYLPTGGFKWMTEKQITNLDLAKYKEDSTKGLILEVDLEYLRDLEYPKDDYACAAEKIKDNKDMLSPFCKRIGLVIKEFNGLKSKMYSYIKDNNQHSKPAKGIKKIVIKKDIKHENYKQTLFNNKQTYHTMKTIRRNNHQIGSYELNKVSLSCFDDKRYIHDNAITSYAYGHYKINTLKQS